jgi:hypothetical protein
LSGAINGNAPVAVCDCAFEDREVERNGLRVEGGMYFVNACGRSEPRSVVLSIWVLGIVLVLGIDRCAGVLGRSIVRSAGVGSIVSTIVVDAMGVLIEGLEASWFVSGEKRRAEKILGAENAEQLSPEMPKSNLATVAFQQ